MIDYLALAILAVLAMSLASLPLWLFEIWSKYRVQKYFRILGQRLGLNFQKQPSELGGEAKVLGGELGGELAVRGLYKGRWIETELCYTKPPRAFPITRVTLRSKEPIAAKARIFGKSFFAITPEGLYQRFEDPYIDDRLVFETESQELASKLRDPTVLESLRHALEQGSSRGELLLEADRLQYSDPKHVSSRRDVDLLIAVVELLHLVAQRLEDRVEH